MLRRISTLRPLIATAHLTVGTLICLLVSSPAAGEQEIEFKFNPPTPITYTLTTKTTKITDMGQDTKRIDITESRGSMSIKKTEGGYSMVCTPVSTSITRDGKKVENPLISLLQDIVVTIDLDAQGQIKELQGFDKLVKKMDEEFRRTMTPEEYKTMSAMLPGIEQAAVAKERADWSARIGSFVGKTARIGDAWKYTDTTELPVGGTIVYDTVMKFDGPIKQNDRDCVRINYMYQANTSAVAQFTTKWMEDLLKSGVSPDKMPKVLDVSVSGQGSRVIDPATMLIYSEKTDRTITMVLDVPEQGKKTFSRRETSTHTYEYPKQ